MTTDPTIHEQSYRYFLQEAPELLQVIEQELFSLREDFNISKVYTLMRATHTLKGAAASIGLETIQIVAHTLEDIFRAICKPELSIDLEVEALLFEGYECLRLLLADELAGGGSTNDVELLERTAIISTRLQEKLADYFSQEAYIPSSQELGFDLTQSIFEVGVTKGLDELATAITNGHPQEIAALLRTKAEVFFGLAESLNLPGFGAIAQVVLTTLDKYPHQAVAIARVALVNFQEARTSVLNGDRSQGGQVSFALQQLTEILDNLPQQPQDRAENRFTEIVVKTEPHNDQPDPDSLTRDDGTADFVPSPSQLPISSTSTVRVDVEHLEQLNYFIGELLTNQNRQSLENEQLYATVRVLVAKLQQHQQLLNQLQDLSEDEIPVTKPLGWKHQSHNKPEPGDWAFLTQDDPVSDRLKNNLFKITEQSQFPSRWQDNKQFDSLELTTHYSKFHSLIQSLLEDSVQLGEATDGIEMFARQSRETLDKQRRLLNYTRDCLTEAQTLPLEDLFKRFPHILRHLEVIYKKQATLTLQGNNTLVDKAVAEKLYDPLLHLVRNAFDHGIESSTVRQKYNKPEKGQISICAYHQGRYLVVEVSDDGRGLDFEKIRAKAVECQLVSWEQSRNLDETQLADLIFEPGFSTASSVNELSGRGIGLDVVRTHLHTIRGSVRVSTQPNQGTTFQLQIPLSLTIANLLLCQAGDQIYALFTNSIEEVLIPTPDQVRYWEEGKALWWNKGASRKLIPIYQLTQALSYSSSIPQASVIQANFSYVSQQQVKPLILIRYRDEVFGLEVEQLLGDQELVIRPLGTMIAPPHYIYGSCILADGRLALVIDGSTLMECLSEQQIADGSNSHFTNFTSPILSPSLERSRSPLAAHKGASRLLTQAPTIFPEAPISNNRNVKSNKNILLVDDSITVRQTLALTLEKAGYQVFEAKDGYEAMEILRRHTQIHLIFCDIEMPRMNGFEFLKNCRQDSALVNIPIVMLTSRSNEKHRLLALNLGANAYITKPYLEHMLLATLTDVLEKKY